MDRSTKIQVSTFSITMNSQKGGDQHKPPAGDTPHAWVKVSLLCWGQTPHNTRGSEGNNEPEDPEETYSKVGLALSMKMPSSQVGMLEQ